MKKKQVIIIVGVIVALGFVISSYYYGFKKGYSNGYQNGLVFGCNLSDNIKGDGKNWYVECNGNENIYHSTLKCKKINNSIQINIGFNNKQSRISQSKFCSKCMDENLMLKCSEWLQSDWSED